MRHSNPCHSDGADKFRPVQIFGIGQRRAFYFNQLVDRHAFGLRIEVGKAGNQACAFGTGFIHADDAAAADFQTGIADFAQSIHAVFVFARMDDVVVAFGVGVEVVVVVVQTGFFEVFSHAVLEHAEGAAHFHAQALHRADDFGNDSHVFRFGAAPCRAHAETAGTARLGNFGFFDDFVHVHHLLFAQIGVVVCRLRAVGAVFGAAAGFDGEQGGKLDFARVEVLAVDFGGLENEVEERQSKQSLDIAFFPITRSRMRLALGLTAQGYGRYGHSVFFRVYSDAVSLTA